MFKYYARVSLISRRCGIYYPARDPFPEARANKGHLNSLLCLSSDRINAVKSQLRCIVDSLDITTNQPLIVIAEAPQCCQSLEWEELFKDSSRHAYHRATNIFSEATTQWEISFYSTHLFPCMAHDGVTKYNCYIEMVHEGFRVNVDSFCALILKIRSRQRINSFNESWE